MNFIKYFFIFCFLLNLSHLNAQNAETEDKAFGKAESLSETEAKASKEYINQAKFDKEYQAGCAKDPSLCSADTHAFKTAMGKSVEDMVPMAAKMYAAFFGLQNNKIPHFIKNPKPEDPQTEDKFDYCMVPTMLVEIVSSATLMIQTKPVEERIQKFNTGIPQLDALYVTSEQHKQRATAAKIQFAGWGVSAACYTVLVASSLAKPGGSGVVTKGKKSMSVYGKLVASAVLATFYGKVMEAHKARAKVVEAYANSLPHKGDCNPINETSCFCNEQMTKQLDPANYMKYCSPREYQDPTRAFSPVSCIDSKNQVDHSCKCRQTNSCAFKNYAAEMARLPHFAVSGGSLFSGLSTLDSGIATGDLLSQGANNLAFAKKFLKDHPDLGNDLLANKNPSENSKGMYKALEDFGTPTHLAKILSEAPQGTATLASLSPIGSSAEFKNSKISPDNLKKIQQVGHMMVSRGTGGKSGKNNSEAGNPFASLFNKGNKPSGNSDGVQIEEFTQKAINAAEIRETNDDQTNVFEYITFRYKQSAWPKLINNE